MVFKLLVYGSLRAGAYNYTRFQNIFGKNNYKKLDQVTIKGFDLYDLGSYPGIKSGTESSTLVCDIIECSQSCYDAIVSMEVGAGYEVYNLNVDGKLYPIFVYKGSIDPRKRIKEGDWVKYLNLELQETKKDVWY